MKWLVGPIVMTAVAAADPWRVEPSVLVGIENFDYHEDVTNAESKHHGTQETGRLEAVATNGNWSARASFGYTDGAMVFEGTDQTGRPITPLADASGHMTDSELTVGRRFAIVDRLWVGGYVGIGRRTWDRDLRPVGSGGYREDYSWLTFPIAAVAETQITPAWTAAMELALVIPSPGSMRLHLSDFDPTYADLDLDLRCRPDPRFRLRSEYALGPLHVVGQATYEATRMVDGPATQLIINGVPQKMGAAEPETHTQRISILVGLGYLF